MWSYAYAPFLVSPDGMLAILSLFRRIMSAGIGFLYTMTANKRKDMQNPPPLLTWILPALLALVGCFGLALLIPSPATALSFSHSIFSVLLFLLLYFCLHRSLVIIWPVAGREWLIAGLISFIFSLCMAFGVQLDMAGHVVLGSFRTWAAVLSLAILLCPLLLLSFRALAARRADAKASSGRAASAWDRLSDGKQWGICAVVILLCWLPVFLAVYPGFFVYDAWDEYMQVAVWQFNNHHPLTHVLLLGGAVQLGFLLTGSYNIGIAFFIVMQMLALAGIFSYSIIILRRESASFATRLIAVLYYGFFPSIVMFALCSAKDALFMGMFMLVFLHTRTMCADADTFFSSRRRMTAFTLAALGFMLLRHNALYAFVPFALILLYHMKKYRKKLLALILPAIILTILVNKLLLFGLAATPGGRQELLTVPIQQMARLWTYRQEDMTMDDKEILYEIIPSEALMRYRPKLADPVKYYFDNEAFAANPLNYTRLWWGWGLKYPGIYLNAWLMTSYGFWYPDTIIDVYEGNVVHTFTYGDSSYFGYEVEPPGNRESQISWLDDLYRRIALDISWQKVPVISMLFSPGFMFWLLLYVIAWLWLQRSYTYLVPFTLALLLWFTFIFGPTYLVRYVVGLWPLIPWFFLSLKTPPSGAVR